MIDDLGTWLTVWDADGDTFLVEAHNEQSIDAAVTRHIDSNGSRDSLLSLDFTDGRTFRIRASSIASWALSTPEVRRRGWELEQMQKAEDERFRHELGIWEDVQ